MRVPTGQRTQCPVSIAERFLLYKFLVTLSTTKPQPLFLSSNRRYFQLIRPCSALPIPFTLPNPSQIHAPSLPTMSPSPLRSNLCALCVKSFTSPRSIKSWPNPKARPPTIPVCCFLVFRRSRCRLLMRMPLPRSSRLQHHFRPSILPIIKVLIRRRRLIQLQFMRNDHRRLRFPRRDQISQFPVVRLHVSLPGSHFLSLHPEIPEVKRDLAFFLPTCLALLDLPQ